MILSTTDVIETLGFYLWVNFSKDSVDFYLLLLDHITVHQQLHQEC